MLQSLSSTLAESALVSAIRHSEFAYPLLSSLHIVGIGILLGNILLLDLRMPGMNQRAQPAEDAANLARLAKLLRFASSTTDTVSVSLADYKARMKEGQAAIYYITADTPAAARNSPQLEIFRKKGIEVLLMTDRVDEWALNFVHEFDGTPLQSVAKGAFDLGKLQDEEEKKAAEDAAETFKPVLAKLKEALKDKAEDVRVTSRLVDSPACLVVTDDGMSMQLARMLKQAGQQAPEVKPVLEVNPEHALVKKLDGSVHFHDLAHILFDQALLAEGGLPEDPAAYVKRVNALLS